MSLPAALSRPGSCPSSKRSCRCRRNRVRSRWRRPRWPDVDCAHSGIRGAVRSDLSELATYLALAYLKLAVIAEEIAWRRLAGAGVGPGFDTAHPAAPGLLQLNLACSRTASRSAALLPDSFSLRSAWDSPRLGPMASRRRSRRRLDGRDLPLRVGLVPCLRLAYALRSRGRTFAAVLARQIGRAYGHRNVSVR
jgi:hypothetical protein